MTDKEMGLIFCRECRTLLKTDGEEAKCPVCNSRVQSRIGNSLEVTWALTICAIILYIPANLFPIMDIQFLGKSSPSTILGGVFELYHAGMYFICAVVFVASFVVPIFKLVVLLYLLLTVGKESKISRKNKTKLFHLIEFMGKWSMLDVFVVSILTGLIHGKGALKITGGLGLIFFAIVVVVTLLASKSFDTRLIWDEVKEK